MQIPKKMQVEQIHGPNVKTLQVRELEYLLQSHTHTVFATYGLKEEGRMIVARAPARLDIMGGIADYCGSHVFEMTLNKAAVAACQAREDNDLYAWTVHTMPGLKSNLRMSLDDLYTDTGLKSYAQVKNLFSEDIQTAWTGYVLGCFFALLKEKKIEKFPHGAAIILKSDIPMGAGIASSAAIEVATLTALNHLYALKLDALDIARLAQIVENRIVGAPCGIMDQVTAAAGMKDKIISILCQPDHILEHVDCPQNVNFIGIHSKKPRSTKSNAYIDTRTAAFMGLSILKAELGWEKLKDNYLCNISVQEFRESCEPLLPQQMHGSAFLEKYGETDDPVTQVDPEKVYAVRDRVTHPIYENARVKLFIKALKNAGKYPERAQAFLKIAGELMYESNSSYRDLAALGSPEIDGIVNIAQKIGEQGGIYGAKITGGGGGGTVVLLCYGDVSTSLTQIISAYKLAWGIETETLSGSSPGASEFGHIVWELKEMERLQHF